MTYRIHYHDGTTEDYPPLEVQESDREAFGGTGWSTSTRDGVFSIQYGRVQRGDTLYLGDFKHHVMIPLTSIRRIEEVWS